MVVDNPDPFPMVRVDQIPQEENPQRWLVEQLWGDSSVGVIGGAPKCSKTWLGLDLALSVAYSRQVSDRFTFGVLGKYIREELAGYTSSSVTFDAGLQYQTDFRSMRLGMVIQHFGPDASFSGTFPDYRTSVAFDEPQTLDFETAPTPINFKFGLVADFESFLGVSLGENVTANIAAGWPWKRK